MREATARVNSGLVMEVTAAHVTLVSVTGALGTSVLGTDHVTTWEETDMTTVHVSRRCHVPYLLTDGIHIDLRLRSRGSVLQRLLIS